MHGVSDDTCWGAKYLIIGGIHGAGSMNIGRTPIWLTMPIKESVGSRRWASIISGDRIFQRVLSMILTCMPYDPQGNILQLTARAPISCVRF